MIEPGWHPTPALTAEWPRERITTTLLQALKHPLVVVCAAAGFGKTVAGHQLWQAWTGARAWWQVSAADQQPEAGRRSLTSAARQAWGLPPRTGSGLPELLAELPQASGGLLIIDDISNWPSSSLWGDLGQLIAAMTPGCHLLLLCRMAPPLPVTLWRSQGRLAWLDDRLLQLTGEEWQTAGFTGSVQGCGWWGAQQAARLGSGHWNAALAAWIHEAWFGALPATLQDMLGAASLLPQLGIDELAAVLDQPPALAWSSWAELLAHGAPLVRVGQDDSLLAIDPVYRLYVSQAWRRSHSEAWAAACTRLLHWLLHNGRPADAARLAHEAGLPELQDLVIRQAGWTLFYSSQRQLLQALVRQPNPASEAATLLHYAWLIEAEKMPHRAEAGLLQLQAQLQGEARALAHTLLACMSWQYDDHVQTAHWAGLAVQGFSHDLHPAFALALLGQANALLGAGQPQAAAPLLYRAQALATRDGLGLLQLEILQRRALSASETGDSEGALSLAHEARRLASQLQGSATPVLDSVARLAAWLHLQRLDIDQARQALELSQTMMDSHGEYWSFPHRLLQALFALAQQDMEGARQQVDWLSQRLGEQFYCQKWQNDAALAQTWLASRQLDRPRLLQLEQQLAGCTWDAGVHRDRRRILLAATRLLLQQTDDMQELQQLQHRLRQQGMTVQAASVQLIMALLSEDREALLACLQQDAAAGRAFDYIWLGSRSVGPLERLLGAPELIHAPHVLQFLREQVQRLLQPAPAASAAAADDSPPPAGLTAKEWQILQLIGQQLSNEQIAARLFVSLATVKTHINHIYGKLGIRTRAEAVHHARSLA